MDPRKLIGASSDLQERGPAIRFEIDDGGEPAPAFAIRFEGVVYAYFNRCAHVSLELDFLPGRLFDTSGRYLICANHGALYEPDSGRCTGGPCNGRGLQPVAVTERNGRIELLQHVRANAAAARSGTGPNG